MEFCRCSKELTQDFKILHLKSAIITKKKILSYVKDGCYREGEIKKVNDANILIKDII